MTGIGLYVIWWCSLDVALTYSQFGSLLPTSFFWYIIRVIFYDHESRILSVWLISHTICYEVGTYGDNNRLSAREFRHLERNCMEYPGFVAQNLWFFDSSR